jgi:hypothetical protein
MSASARAHAIVTEAANEITKHIDTADARTIVRLLVRPPPLALNYAVHSRHFDHFTF